MSTQAITKLEPQGRLLPKQSADHVPNCQKCHKPMTLLHESDDTYQWGCYACGYAHVFSKPRAVAAAKYRVAMERHAEQLKRIRQHEARKKYFILGGK